MVCVEIGSRLFIGYFRKKIELSQCYLLLGEAVVQKIWASFYLERRVFCFFLQFKANSFPKQLLTPERKMWKFPVVPHLLSVPGIVTRHASLSSKIDSRPAPRHNFP